MHFRLELKKAVEREEINPKVAEEAKKGIEKADSVLIRLGSLTEVIIKYQKIIYPLSEGVHTFFEEVDKDPLMAIVHLKPLLLMIPRFKEEFEELGENQSRMNKVKLQDMYTMEMGCLEEELDFWVDDSKKALNGHLDHLKILLRDKDGKIKEKAERELAA